MIRTSDTRFRKPLLYPLSYRGTGKNIAYLPENYKSAARKKNFGDGENKEGLRTKNGSASALFYLLFICAFGHCFCDVLNIACSTGYSETDLCFGRSLCGPVPFQRAFYFGLPLKLFFICVSSRNADGSIEVYFSFLQRPF